MLKKYFAIINIIRAFFDLLMVASLWNLTYYIRFYSNLFTTTDIPKYERHLAFTIPVAIIIYASRTWAQIYKPMRIESTTRQYIKQIEASLVGFIFTILFFYYIEEATYSRVLMAIFFVLLILGALLSHFLLMHSLRYTRSKGYNLRHFAIIGTGKEALRLLKNIQNHSYFGLNCSFFIDNKPSLKGKFIHNIPVYTDIDDLVKIAKTKSIDELYLAKSGSSAQIFYPILKEAQRAGITIRILPDWGGLTAVCNPTTMSIGSSVLFTTSEPPLAGHNLIVKDISDKVIASTILIILLFPMILIAILIKLTSRGPVFYKQMRIGMDNKEFNIIKFRSMHISSSECPAWTKENDPRKTRFGSFLRSSSLDELPQLINVLKGDMSLVGPRPEQPYYVNKFSEEYKRYMFRHKVKSGMTGWAQINGFRGDSSLRKRVQYDINYIQNWSLWFDLLILLRTPRHIMKGKNAY